MKSGRFNRSSEAVDVEAFGGSEHRVGWSCDYAHVIFQRCDKKQNGMACLFIVVIVVVDCCCCCQYAVDCLLLSLL